MRRGDEVGRLQLWLLQLSSSNGRQSSLIVAMREFRIWSTTQLGFRGADVIGEERMKVLVDVSVSVGTCVLE